MSFDLRGANSTSLPDYAGTTSEAQGARLDGATRAALELALARTPPLWPLADFVAVNPFLGLKEWSFSRALEHASAVHWAQFRDAEGRQPAFSTPPAMRVMSVADAVDALRLWPTPWALRLSDEVGKWCAAFFADSPWQLPAKHLGLYKSWLAAARLDANLEVLGLPGVRKTLRALPEEHGALLALAAHELRLPAAKLTLYCERLLARVAGWAALAQGRVRFGSGPERNGTLLAELLAVCAAYELALARATGTRMGQASDLGAWIKATQAREPLFEPDYGSQLANRDGGAFGRALGERELIYRKDLARQLCRGQGQHLQSAGRCEVQAVFCIDVRSEALRVSLEAELGERGETYGFAGFFGVPLRRVAPGQRPQALAPVLLAARQEVSVGAKRDLLGTFLQRWRRAPVASFAFVEPAGLAMAPRLLAAAWFGFGAKRRVQPVTDELSCDDWPLAEKLALATSLIKNLCLQTPLARLVMFCGHNAAVKNNPHAASLACGACGGHSGEVNARVAARLLNEPAVRAGLLAAGHEIPADTLFLAALHNTTTSDVALLDLDRVPAERRAEVQALGEALDRAGEVVATRRSGGGQQESRRRASDPSELRAEWGLAGNAAFVAGPRALTRGLDLKGRVFLHSYDWRRDPGARILEMILTAPVEVASWINLQYFASAAAPEVFGAGTKLTHNIVANLGVAAGSRRDLRVGLPFESVFAADGQCMHALLRLQVVVAAPRAQLEAVLERCPEVRRSFDLEWMALIALEEHGEEHLAYHYLAQAGWRLLCGGQQPEF